VVLHASFLQLTIHEGEISKFIKIYTSFMTIDFLKKIGILQHTLMKKISRATYNCNFYYLEKSGSRGKMERIS